MYSIYILRSVSDVKDHLAGFEKTFKIKTEKKLSQDIF